jgi:thiamine biosynthesis protein ThiI
LVDLADDRAYVYSVKVPGPGGLPLSSQWKMLAVLDSGPLSILAAYSMMRRGCMVELFIPISRQIGIFAPDFQFDLARRLRRFVTRNDYRAYAFELDELHHLGVEGEIIEADMKHYVRNAALGFARQKRFKGIILSDLTGSLSKIQGELEGAAVPPGPFDPLIGLDKEDLIQLSGEVGVTLEGLGWASGETIQNVARETQGFLRKDPTEFVKPVLL